VTLYASHGYVPAHKKSPNGCLVHRTLNDLEQTVKVIVKYT